MNVRIYTTGFLVGLMLVLSPVTQSLTFNVPSQYSTIQAALNAAKTPHASGQAVTIAISPGVYREDVRWASVSSAAVEIVGTGATGANVVITGSEPGVWTSLGGGLYSVVWDFNWSLSLVPPNWPSVPIELRHREMIWVNDKPLKLVLSCSVLNPGEFCIDTLNKRMVFNSQSEPSSVEVAMRQTPLIIEGDNITLRGLTVEHGAAALDQSQAVVSGRNIVIEASIWRQSVSGGLNTSDTINLTTKGNSFSDNGMTGWGGAYNVGLRSDGDTARSNNWRGFPHNWTGWNVAGIKLLRSDANVFLNTTITDNLTHGFWLDFDHRDITINGATITNNLNAGLYLEASPGAITVRNSRLSGNAYGTQYAGIFAANTTDVTLENVHTQSNRAALFIGGESPCRNVSGACIPVAARWFIHNSTFESSFASIQVATGFDGWRNTLGADFNHYVSRSQQFLYPSPYGRQTLAQSQALTGQDKNSDDKRPVATVTPVWTVTTISPTKTATPLPIVPTVTPVASVTPAWTVTPTPAPGVWEFHFEGYIKIWVGTPAAP